MTIIMDLKSGRILYSAEGKSRESIIPFLKKLRDQAINLKAIALDMGKPFSSAVTQYLPEVDIVYDHFHVTALINKTLDDLRKAQQRSCSESFYRAFKGSRFLFLKNYDSLDINGMERLNTLLGINEPLFKAHALKEQFRLFWRKESREAGYDFLIKWCTDAVLSGVAQLRKLCKSILKHAEGLLNFFDHRITSGKIEGINNKIKTLKRQAYGYRDIEYFKLRLLHLHNQKITLI